MVVGLSTVKLVALVEPKSTRAVPVRFAPVMVTVVPPLLPPMAGVSESTAGRFGVTPDVDLSQLILTDGACVSGEKCVVWPRGVARAGPAATARAGGIAATATAADIAGTAATAAVPTGAEGEACAAVPPVSSAAGGPVTATRAASAPVPPLPPLSCVQAPLPPPETAAPAWPPLPPTPK